MHFSLIAFCLTTSAVAIAPDARYQRKRQVSLPVEPTIVTSDGETFTKPVELETYSFHDDPSLALTSTPSVYTGASDVSTAASAPTAIDDGEETSRGAVSEIGTTEDTQTASDTGTGASSTPSDPAAAPTPMVGAVGIVAAAGLAMAL